MGEADERAAVVARRRFSTARFGMWVWLLSAMPLVYMGNLPMTVFFMAMSSAWAMTGLIVDAIERGDHLPKATPDA